MALPEFNENGDLPAGRHSASLRDVFARFGMASKRREQLVATLQRIHDLAQATGSLDCLVVFGSFVSDVPEPNDVDVMLVMQDDFQLMKCPSESRVLFDHLRWDMELGASVFWMRPAMLLGEPLDSFLLHWEYKRDGQRRGIVEIRK